MNEEIKGGNYWLRRGISRRGILKAGAVLAAAPAMASLAAACGDDDDDDTSGGTGGGGDTIKVGILHSLSGTMAVSRSRGQGREI